MPKPNAPSPGANYLPTAIQIGRLQCEIDQLQLLRDDGTRSEFEKARISDQIAERNRAQLYLYNGIHEDSPAAEFADLQKRKIAATIQGEAVRIAKIKQSVRCELPEDHESFSELQLQSKVSDLEKAAKALQGDLGPLDEGGQYDGSNGPKSASKDGPKNKHQRHRPPKGH